MTRQAATLVSFNKGIVSKFGLARVDVPRLRLAAQQQTNWMPRVLGSMMLRPGTQFIGNTKSDAVARTIPFVRSASSRARLELTDALLRVLLDGDSLLTRPAVTAAVTNGAFVSDISGWTDADESGAASTWVTGYAQLLGTGTNFAILRQEVTVNQANTEHALRVVIARGPVTLRVGSTSAGEEYIGETTLGTGQHSLSFTPTGASFHIQISSALSYPVLVDSITVEAAGVVEITTPWLTADLPNIRYSTSGDVIYVVDGRNQQYKIERRGERSWSVVQYVSNTGPFRIQNTSNITITASALEGEVTLTASKPLFRSGQNGLFKLSSQGQQVSAAISAQNTFSNPIRVAGTGEQRRFGILISGTFVATVHIQYSIGEPGTWIDLTTTYAAPVSTSYLDNQDNQVIYYRIGVKTGNYTSGTANVALTYASGSITGIARIVGFTSSTEVTAVVLQTIGSTTATPDWSEGEWSIYRGYPAAVALHEGRLWFAGNDKIWGSISDAYEDFDEEFEGDAGPISRSLGEGPIDTPNWLLSLGRLLIGTPSDSASIAAAKIDGNMVRAARSSSFDEPLTPTSFAIKAAATRGIFVDRSEQRLYELSYNIDSNDYVSEDLTALVPDLNQVGIVGIAVQMKPDVRIHCWRSDGTVGVLVFDRTENVICWVEVETNGEVEDVSVLPGAVEDEVYYIVARTWQSATYRFHERWALESECDGQPVAKLADCHVNYSGVATTTITGLSHLDTMAVTVWGWNTASPFVDDDGNVVGRDLGTFAVSGGQITGLPASVTNACVGLPYTAQYKSAKLVTLDSVAPLNQMKKGVAVGLVLVDTHYLGIRYGESFDTMYDLPKAEEIKVTNTNKIWSERETRMFPLGGRWSPDTRLCLRAASPRPATVLAATIAFEGASKV